MKYNIEINYTTGGSFGSSEESEVLDFEFESIETADENCKRIVDHYKAYESVQDSRSSKKWDDYKDERWFNNSQDESGKSYPEYTVLLIDDKGCIFPYDVSSHIGYFETLRGVKVVTKELPEYIVN